MYGNVWYYKRMDDSVRQRLAKNEIMFSLMAEVYRHTEVLYRTAKAELFCPHCLQSVTNQSFETLEKYRCSNCKLTSTFVIWSKAQDQGNWKAALCPIN